MARGRARRTRARARRGRARLVALGGQRLAPTRRSRSARDQLVLQAVDALDEARRAARAGLPREVVVAHVSSSMPLDQHRQPVGGVDRRRRTGRGRPPAPRSRSSRAQRAWTVVTPAPRRGASIAPPAGARSASAALGEGQREDRLGRASPCSTSQAKRATSTRVLPLPAPPTTSSGPPGCVTASRCAAERPSRAAGTTARICRGWQPTGTALDADWLGACRRAVGGLRDVLARRTRRPPSAPSRRATRGEGGDRTLVIDERGRGRRVRRARRAARRRAPLHRGLARSAASVDFGDDGDPRRDRPDRRLAERQARCCRTTRCRSPSPTARRWRTSRSRYVYDFGAGEEWTARARRGRACSTASRSIRRCRAPRAATGAWSSSVSSRRDPRWIAAARTSSQAGLAAPARDRLDRHDALPGRGRAVRRHGHAARLPRGRRRRGAADRARGGRARRVPAVRRPLAAPLDVAARSPVVAARVGGDACGVGAGADRLRGWRSARTCAAYVACAVGIEGEGAAALPAVCASFVAIPAQACALSATLMHHF